MYLSEVKLCLPLYSGYPIRSGGIYVLITYVDSGNEDNFSFGFAVMDMPERLNRLFELEALFD